MALRRLFISLSLFLSIGLTHASIVSNSSNKMFDFGHVKAKMADSHTVRMLPVLSLEKGSSLEEINSKKSRIEKMMKIAIGYKSLEDLKSLEGKMALKNEIKTGVNQILSKTKVSDVYYKSFQIN